MWKRIKEAIKKALGPTREEGSKKDLSLPHKMVRATVICPRCHTSGRVFYYDWPEMGLPAYNIICVRCGYNWKEKNKNGHVV